MRVLLVASPKTVMGMDRGIRLPNLGLNSIAANVQNPDVDVRVLDLVLAQKNPIKKLLSVLGSFNPDVVGFSCMTHQYQDTLKLAASVRAHRPGTVIVLGGYHPTVDFEKMLNPAERPVVDFIIRNEGETAFSRLLEEIQGKRDFCNIPSLSHAENGSLIHNPPGALLDLDSLKIPERKNRILKRGFHIMGSSADAVETSRGCVNRCKFCCIRQMYGTAFRNFKIDRVIADIQNVSGQGTRSIMFVDDNMTVDTGRFERLCREIIGRKLNEIRYTVQGTISGLKRSPDLPRLMSEAGVDLYMTGIENAGEGNVHFLDTKPVQYSDTRDVIRELHGYGISVMGSFIIGNPGDTRETIVDNFHYANQVDVDFPLFLILTPFPRTEIRDELSREGLITNADDFSKYDLFRANVRTRQLSPEELEKIRDEIAFKVLQNGSRFRRLASKYAAFSMKLILSQLISQPKEVFGYIRGR